MRILNPVEYLAVRRVVKLIGRHDYLEIEEILKPISLKFRLNKVYIFLCTVLVRTVPKLKGISLQQHFRMMESFRITYPDTMPDKKNLNILLTQSIEIN